MNYYIKRRYGSISNYIDNYLTEESFQKLTRKSSHFKLYRNRLRTIETLLQKIYPDKWEIKKENNFINIIIWFPKITLTNWRKQKHDIEDLYVNLRLEYNLLLRHQPFYGLRTTVSYIEHINSYWHSHLLTKIVKDERNVHFELFCIGLGIISQTLAVLKDEFIESSFELLLYQIQDYLVWESASGGPYIRIDTFSYNSPLETLHYSLDIKDIYKKFIKKGLFDITIQENRLSSFEVINDDYFEDEVSKITKDYISNKEEFTDVLEYILAYKGENGKYYSREIVNIPVIKEPILEFKSKKIYYKIKNDENEYVKQYAHPKITEYIARELSEEITKAYIEENRAD